jgi:rod shape-determining protein MreC
MRAVLTSKRSLALLLVGLFIVFLLFPEMQRRPVYFLTRPVVYVVSLIQSGVGGMVNRVHGVWTGYLHLVDLRRENDRLRLELAEIQEDNIQLQEALQTNERLRALLDLKLQTAYTVVAAGVVGRDPTNWHRSLVINKGENDGIAVDMGVIVPGGVVGRIIKVMPSLAQVRLLTDREIAVTAVLQETRDEGIVQGTEGGRIRMKYLSTLSEARPGQRVITSGLDGSFPKGFPIGTLERVERRETALFQEAELSPSADFSKLEEVLVVTAISEAERPHAEGRP